MTDKEDNMEDTIGDEIEAEYKKWMEQLDDDLRDYIQDLHGRFTHFCNQLWSHDQTAELWFKDQWLFVMDQDGEMRLLPRTKVQWVDVV